MDTVMERGTGTSKFWQVTPTITINYHHSAVTTVTNDSCLNETGSEKDFCFFVCSEGATDMILINSIICITGQASSEQRHEFCSVTGRLKFSNVCYFILHWVEYLQWAASRIFCELWRYLGISTGCFHISWFNYLKRNIKIIEFVCETNYCKVQ